MLSSMAWMNTVKWIEAKNLRLFLCENVPWFHAFSGIDVCWEVEELNLPTLP